MNRISPQNYQMQTPEHEETQIHILKQLHPTIFTVKKNSILSHKQVQTVNVNDIMECKICLQTSLDSDQVFIQPCLCTGSLMYVHQHCFQQWMKRLIIQKNIRQAQKLMSQGIQCELCKMKYAIKINYQKVCTSRKKLTQKVKHNKIQFTLLISLAIVSIILMSISAALMPTDIFDITLEDTSSNSKKIQNSSKDGWQKIVLIVSVFVLAIITTLSFFMLIREFCFSYNMEFRYKGKQLKTMKIILEE